MFNLVKGTHDVILDEAQQYSYIETLLERVAEMYGYSEFRTPVLEHTDLFIRSVGDSSDIVRKEMYTFLDHSDRSITLRPEFTAGIVRSMVNAKLFANQDFPVKAFYCGPNFRYERPQQGRYRQFNQFGVECVGVNQPERDAEIISMGYNSLLLLGFKDVKLVINTLGDEETRTNYQKALREYFESKLDEMCDDCKERFNLNILRILDCKVPHDREIIAKAPKITDFLSEKAKADFDKVLKMLDVLQIPYELDSELVRGLDYYTGVVFEFHYTSKLGKNYGAIGAGGHYGHLVSEIGGPDIEGCGYAMGIERLSSVINDDEIALPIEKGLDVYIMPIGLNDYSEVLETAEYLRLNGFKCEVCLEGKNMGQMFKKAERRGAKLAIIIGETEINEGVYKVKDLKTQEQINIAREYILDFLDKTINASEHHHEHHHDHECCCGGEHEYCEGEECECGEHEMEEHEHGCCCNHHHEGK